jgi:hypothetical protein
MMDQPELFDEYPNAEALIDPATLTGVVTPPPAAVGPMIKLLVVNRPGYAIEGGASPRAVSGEGALSVLWTYVKHHEGSLLARDNPAGTNLTVPAERDFLVLVTAAAHEANWPPATPSAPARNTDPQTSHQAARTEPDVGRFSRKSRQAKLLDTVGLEVRHHNRGLTDQEATRRVLPPSASPSSWDGCRRRMSDLRAAGYLMDSGVRRKNHGSNDEAIVWTLTAAGRAAHQRLQETGWSR